MFNNNKASNVITNSQRFHCCPFLQDFANSNEFIPLSISILYLLAEVSSKTIDHCCYGILGVLYNLWLHDQINAHPWMDTGQLPDGDWSTGGRVNSCEVSLKVGCLPWGKRPALS